MKYIDKIIKESITRIIKESIEGEFIPTPQWIKQKYNEFNALYFDGVLPKCGLKLMSADTNQLGTFHFSKKSNFKHFLWAGKPDKDGDIALFYDKKNDCYVGVNRNNIYQTLGPVIAINIKYSRPLDDIENTLIHEMCHYWQFVVNGIWKRSDEGHGEDFLEIAEQVYAKSNGKVKITPRSDELPENAVSDDWINKRGQYAIFGDFGDVRGILLSKSEGIKNNINTMASTTRAKKLWISYDPKLLSKLIMHHYTNRNKLSFSTLFPGFNFDDYQFTEIYDAEANKSDEKLWYFNPKAAVYITTKANGDKKLLVTTAQKAVERGIEILGWTVLEKYTDPKIIDRLYREGYVPGNRFENSIYCYTDEVFNIINNK